MSDDKKDHTADELQFIDKALLRIGATVAAECIRRGPEGVAAVTRQIVEAMVKERREMRPSASTWQDQSCPHCREPYNFGPAGGVHACKQKAQPTRKPGEFDETLVERLWWVWINGSADAVQAGIESKRSCEQQGIRAILAELAAGPVVLPSCEDIAKAWNAPAGPSGEINAAWSGVYDMLSARLGPIIAAKEAELNRLDELTERQQLRIAEFEREVASNGRAYEMCNRERSELEAKLGERTAELAEARTKIAELETFPERIRERIQAVKGTNLVTAVGELFSFHDYARRAMNDEGIPAVDDKGARNSEMLRLMLFVKRSKERIAELERQLADQAPKVKEFFGAIDALAEAWPREEPIEDNPTLAVWIRKLVDVLGKKAKEQTAEVLRRVNDKISKITLVQWQDHITLAMRAIDEELAKLDTRKTETQLTVAPSNVLKWAPCTHGIEAVCGPYELRVSNNGTSAHARDIRSKAHWSSDYECDNEDVAKKRAIELAIELGATFGELS